MRNILTVVNDNRKYIGIGVVIITVISYIYYDSVKASVFLLPMIALIIKAGNEKAKTDSQRQFRTQFVSCLDVMSGAVSSGYSFENAIQETLREMEQVYGKKSEIYKDLFYINNKLQTNSGLEHVLQSYKKMKKKEEVNEFCDLILISRRTGGDLKEVIKGVRDLIYEQSDLERQINIMSGEKRYEALIMGAMPSAIIIYLKVFSPEFIDCLYGNYFGVIVMSMVMAVNIILIFFMYKICEIKF